MGKKGEGSLALRREERKVEGGAGGYEALLLRKERARRGGEECIVAGV